MKINKLQFRRCLFLGMALFWCVPILALLAHAVDCAAAAVLHDSTFSGKVLVLGSGGFIGSRLVSVCKARSCLWLLGAPNVVTPQKLQSLGYEVLEVRNRRHVDLREPNSLAIFKFVNLHVLGC